jgi:glycine cleavage system H lipoate-binding protein
MLGIFVLLIAADYVIRGARGGALAAVGERVAAGAIRGLGLADFRLPQGLFFHPGHSWAALQPDGSVRVGVDDFVRRLAGTIDAVQTPEAGTEVRQGDSMATLKVGSRTLQLRAPVSGRVTTVNQNVLDRQPDEVGGSLSREWLVSIEPSRLADELGHLSIAAKASKWLGQEMRRVSEFLAAQTQRPAPVGVTLTDGGEPVAGVLGHLDDRGWEEFQKEFLR